MSFLKMLAILDSDIFHTAVSEACHVTVKQFQHIF